MNVEKLPNNHPVKIGRHLACFDGKNLSAYENYCVLKYWAANAREQIRIFTKWHKDFRPARPPINFDRKYYNREYKAACRYAKYWLDRVFYGEMTRAVKGKD